MSRYLERDSHIRNKVKLVLDQSNYARMIAYSPVFLSKQKLKKLIPAKISWKIEMKLFL